MFEALLSGEYCYVLNSRQMGKSSLAVRTVSKLSDAGVRTAFVDLTRIGGANVSAEQWYAGLLAETGRVLELRSEAVAYLREHKEMGGAQRYLWFLHEIALPASESPLVLMLDEIDAVRSLSFSTDELFAGIRQFHNGRAPDPTLSRLTFCLLGAALPSDLIRDARTTPFNVGKRVELRDFTEEEAQGLRAQGLGGEMVLKRVLYWTGGHPFLTQSLCAALIESAGQEPLNPRAVDALVNERYLEERARETDTNLADVGNRLLGRGDPNVGDGERADTLSLYEKLLKGQDVHDDESNPSAARIKMSGVSRLEGGHLKIRNRIYQEVFSRGWIRENMPGQELRRQRRAFWKGALRTAAISATVVAIVGGLAWNNVRLRMVAEQSENRARREEYYASMDMLPVFWEQCNLEQIQSMLDRHRKSPFRGWEWDFWNSRISGSVPTTFETDGSFYPKFSPDGLRIACRVGSWVKILSSRDLRLLRKILVPGRSTLMSWAGNHHILSHTAGNGGETFRLDVETGKVVNHYGSVGIYHHPAVTSSDGRYAVVCDREQHPKIFDLESGRSDAIHVSLGSIVEVVTACFIPKDGLVALAVNDVENKRFGLSLVDRKTLNEVRFIAGPEGADVITATEDGSIVAFGGFRCGVKVVNLRSGKTLANLEDLKPIAMSFSSDGSRLAMGCQDRRARIFAVSPERLALLGEIRGVNTLQFAPESHMLLGSYWMSRLLSSDSFEQRLPSRPFRQRVTTTVPLTLTATEAYIAPIRSGKSTVAERLDLGKGANSAESTSVEGRIQLAPKTDIALVLDRGSTKVRDLNSQVELGELPISQEVWAFDVSQDRRFVAVALTTGELALWDVKSGSVRWKVALPLRITAIAFSPSGRDLAIGSNDGSVWVRRTKDGTWLWKAEPHNGYISSIAFTTDGARLAVGADDDRASILDVSSGHVVVRMVGHGQTVNDIAFSPDGSRLVSSSGDATVRLWDTTTGRETSTLETGTLYQFVSFSPDGTSIAALGTDGKIGQWTTRPSK